VTFWSILRDTFGSILQDYKVVELENFDFWPRWNDPKTGGTVEPDMFAEFSVGDPSKTIAIIFEAKLGQAQYALQWQRQWMAYQRLLKDGEVTADEVFLLAIGGLTGHRARVAEEYKDAISTDTSGEVSINAAAADWRRLTDVVFDHQGRSIGADSRILADVGEALALFGYRHTQSFGTMNSLPAPIHGQASLNVIRNWVFKNV